MIPGRPVYTMLDREYYNEFAELYNETYKSDIQAKKATALPLLNSYVLPEDSEGNPFAYRTNTGSPDPSVSAFASLSKQKYELGFGASSITNEWTTSEEHAEGVEIANGFSASMKNTWGIDAINAGFVIDFGYSNAKGKVYTTTKSSGASGTVNNIDRRSLRSSYGISYDVSSQYGFSWDFGMRTWSTGGQNIPVFGYVLSNLRAAPPIPTLTGVSVEDNHSAKINWQAPEPDGRRPYTGYHVWVRIDDGEFECVTDTALTTETLEYTYTSLQENTTYTFAVSTAGYNGAVSVLSNTKTFSTFAGMSGKEIEFRNNGSTLQWRYVGENDSAYRDLISLVELTGNDGADGKQVELRVYNGYIQWKYTSDSVWNNLIALSELKGEKGDKGDKGDTGNAGTAGEKGDTGNTGTTGADGKNGKDGKDGVGIAKAEINANGELVITYTDGRTANLGKVVGADGKDGLTPFIGENGNWWIGEKDTGMKAATDTAIPANSGTVAESDMTPALIVIGIVAGLALIGNIGLILYIVMKKKKGLASFDIPEP